MAGFTRLNHTNPMRMSMWIVLWNFYSSSAMISSPLLQTTWQVPNLHVYLLRMFSKGLCIVFASHSFVLGSTVWTTVLLLHSNIVSAPTLTHSFLVLLCEQQYCSFTATSWVLLPSLIRSWFYCVNNSTAPSQQHHVCSYPVIPTDSRSSKEQHFRRKGFGGAPLKYIKHSPVGLSPAIENIYIYICSNDLYYYN